MMPLPQNKAALPKPDARLAAAAAYVRPGCVCADIGCDHGLLCVHLAANHLCEKVIACDICEKPLQTAARNLALHGCLPRSECRLGNGLSVLRPDEVQDIVIAGVSGVTVCEILAQAPQFWREDKRFILVPVTKHMQLRGWLYENGFSVLDETPVEAAQRYYTVLYVQYTGCMVQQEPLACAVGKAAKGTPAAAGYLKKVAAQLRKQGNAALAQEVERLAATTNL